MESSSSQLRHEVVHQTVSLKDDQNKRYAITIAVFILLVLLAMLVFYLRDGTVPKSLSPFEFIILGLASLRLIRLFTYDQIMRVVRDLFVETKEFTREDGEAMVLRTRYRNGGKRSLADLFACPWCMGVWVSFFVVFLYFLIPGMRYLVLILALAGVASGIQIIMNGVGSKAEFFKRENNLHN